MVARRAGGVAGLVEGCHAVPPASFCINSRTAFLNIDSAFSVKRGLSSGDSCPATVPRGGRGPGWPRARTCARERRAARTHAPTPHPTGPSRAMAHHGGGAVPRPSGGEPSLFRSEDMSLVQVRARSRLPPRPAARPAAHRATGGHGAAPRPCPPLPQPCGCAQGARRAARIFVPRPAPSCLPCPPCSSAPCRPGAHPVLFHPHTRAHTQHSCTFPWRLRSRRFPSSGSWAWSSFVTCVPPLSSAACAGGGHGPLAHAAPHASVCTGPLIPL
jgi:hypothetical protein